MPMTRKQKGAEKTIPHDRLNRCANLQFKVKDRKPPETSRNDAYLA